MRWSLGVVLLALLFPARAGARLHTVAADVPAPLVTDNARYAVMSDPSGALTVLDTRSAAQSVVQLMPGCYAADGSGGYFLVECDAGDVIYVLNAKRHALDRAGGWPHVVPRRGLLRGDRNSLA